MNRSCTPPALPYATCASVKFFDTIAAEVMLLPVVASKRFFMSMKHCGASGSLKVGISRWMA